MGDSRTTVFISYSHRDRKWLRRLRVHLRPMERDRLIDAWDDRRIKAGMHWQDEIEKALRSARVAVLLVSGDFLASDFIYGTELPPLLEAARNDGMRILPLVVRPCGYSEDRALGRFQAVNDPAKPLSGLNAHDQETMLVELAQQIRQALDNAGSAPFSDAVAPAEASDWIRRLNRTFARQAEVYRRVRREPEILIEGVADLMPEEREMADRFRAGFPERGKDDAHAMLSETPIWTDDPVVLSVRTLDYAELLAVRRFREEKPRILSGGAVCFCESTRELLLHRRSHASDTYKGSLHILSGAYIPPGVGTRPHDRSSLISTAWREVHEEAGIRLNLETLPPMLLAAELTTGFVQFVLLGVNVSESDMQTASPNWEGRGLSRVAFDDLLETLLKHDSNDPHALDLGWVPSGKAHVLAWLALGAPGSKSLLRFGRYSATELFEEVMSRRP